MAEKYARHTIFEHLGSAHIDHEITSAWRRFRSWRATEGHTVLPAHPVTVAAYLVAAADTVTPDGVRAYAPSTLARWVTAILLLGFAGAFRRSELAALTCGDVTMHCLGGIHIRLRCSKTDQEGRGARTMIDDRLAELAPAVDVALAQHVLPMSAGVVGTRSGPVLSAADSMRITVYGRGGHGSMPQTTVDPVVLAAMIVVRLQAVISRETAPNDSAVLTVGRISAGTKSNIIADHAVLELNIRTYSDAARDAILAAIRRIVVAECQASRSPKEPEFELFDRFPPTVNDPDVTARVAAAFTTHFGARATALPLQSASEDFSDIPTALGVPYTYWGIGGIDPDIYREAEQAGRLAEDVSVNHSPLFAPVIQPTLDTGTTVLAVATLAWLGLRAHSL